VQVLLTKFISESEEIKNGEPGRKFVPINEDVDALPETNVQRFEDRNERHSEKSPKECKGSYNCSGRSHDVWSLQNTRNEVVLYPE
jgi:hypothetical protein